MPKLLCIKPIDLSQKNYAEHFEFHTKSHFRMMTSANRPLLSTRHVELIVTLNKIHRSIISLNKILRDCKKQNVAKLKWNYITILMDRLFFYLALINFLINLLYFALNF